MANRYQDFFKMHDIFIDHRETRPGVCVFREQGRLEVITGFSISYLFSDNDRALMYNFDYILSLPDVFSREVSYTIVNEINSAIEIGKVYEEDRYLHFSYTVPYSLDGSIDLDYAFQFTHFLLDEVEKIYKIYNELEKMFKDRI